jgi:predicted transcriptional regulator
MYGIVTQELVYDYLVERNPASPVQIAEDLNVSISAVNKRLLKLMYNGFIDRYEEKSKLDQIYYYPVKEKLK